MALFTSSVTIHHNSAMAAPTAIRKRLVLLRMFLGLMTGVMVGAKHASAYSMRYNTEPGAKGTQTLAFATSSGTIGVVINGVTITIAFVTSDTVSMTALVAAVNASVDPLVQFQLQMTNTRSQVTLTSVADGAILRLGPYDFTARATAALCQNWGEFSISGTDTADAAALAAAINGHPQASKYWAATSAAAVCSVFLISTPSIADGSTSTSMLTTSTAIAIAAQLAAGATGCIVSYARDRIVNSITTVASGTGATAGGARLTGGLGGNMVPAQEAL